MNADSTVRSFKELRMFNKSFPQWKKKKKLKKFQYNLVIFNNTQSKIFVQIYKYKQ